MGSEPPKVWAILEGPTPVDELGLDEDDEDVPEGAEIHMLCKVEINGGFTEANFWFESADDVYEWEKYFKSILDALEIVNVPEGKLH